MKKAKFGFCLPVFGGASAWDHSIDLQALKTMIPTCEKLGFDSLWVPDHLSMGHMGSNLECWTVLSAASQLCERLRLGTLVLCITHRSPALVAKMAATLDVLSNGRLELGLGAGWRGSEQVSYGLPWAPSTKARVQMLIEAIEIIKGMWSNDTFTYTGTYYHIKDAVCNPKPMQKPHPKIWIGGSGEKVVLKAIAKYADAWNIGEFSPEEYARKLRVLRSHCESGGTNYEHIEKSLETVLLITDKKKDLAKVVEWSNWFAKIQGEYSEEEKPAVGGLEDMKARYVLGTVTDVTERIWEYVRAGVQQFMIYFLDFPSMNSARLLAEEVMPSL